MKRLPVNLEIWQWAGMVLVGGQPSDFAKVIEVLTGEKDEDDHTQTAGQAFIESGKPWAIWVEDVKDWPTLAHEAMHVALRVVTDRGCVHCEASEEAYTYTADFILRTVKAAKPRDWKRV